MRYWCLSYPVTSWGTEVEKERWRRTRLSIAAYAYEYEADSIMSDAEFDRLSYEVDLSIPTGNSRMDRFFKDRFDPCTGSWIAHHPDKNHLKFLYEKYWKNR